MNLKLKRLVRTNSSEQYALFDLNQINADQQPTTIGKLDMHYTNEGIYGTILLWDDVSRAMDLTQRKELVQILLDEISTPMGVPNEYVFEFFAPTLDEYEVIHNVGLEVVEDEEGGDDVDEVFDSDRMGSTEEKPALPQQRQQGVVASDGQYYGDPAGVPAGVQALEMEPPTRIEPENDVERAF